MVDRSPSGSSLHHKNVAGLEARCTLDVDYVVGDVIECQGCLEEMSSALLNSTSIPERTTLASLMDVILGSTSQGVTVPDLLVRSQSCVSGRSLIICICLRSAVFPCEMYIQLSILYRHLRRLSYIALRTALPPASFLPHAFVLGLPSLNPSQKMGRRMIVSFCRAVGGTSTGI